MVFNMRISQAIQSGNRCGHCVSAPQFFVAKNSTRSLPWVLKKAKENVRRYYFSNKNYLPHLQFERFSRTKRAMRSEQREALCLVVEALLHHTDLNSLTIGFVQPNTDTIKPVTIAQLAQYIGIGYKRCQRVVRLLKRAGYLEAQHGNTRKTNYFRVNFLACRLMRPSPTHVEHTV